MTEYLLRRYQRADALLAYRLETHVPGASISARWEGDLLSYDVSGQRVVVDPASLSRKRAGAPAPMPAAQAGVSPDGRWHVRVDGGDLVLHDHESTARTRLTHDAEPGVAWASPGDVGGPSTLARADGAELPVLVLWAPDSSRFYTHRIDQRPVPIVTVGKGLSLHYSRPGDPLPIITHHVFGVASGFREDLPVEGVLLLVSPITWQRVWWSDDSSALWLLQDDRGCRSVRLLRWKNGRVDELVHEHAPTYVETTPMIGGRPLVRTLATNEVLWWSERDDWGHLWLLRDGTWTQLTSGALQVRELLAVDEDTRSAWITAGGDQPGENPYYRQLYRVDLDGGGMTRLTQEAADHAVTAHAHGRWFLDCFASPQTPPTTVLRGEDGAVLMELERADTSALRELGWSPPEEVTVLAADGRTQLWGLLFAPHDLDTAQLYPVLDAVYPGPQAARQARHALVGAPLEPHLLDTGGSAASFAALGFAVLVLDGRGTPLRSKSFHDFSHGNLGDAGIADRVAALEQLARSRPWLDLTRVGTYGHSGGGYASARALMVRPDVYKAAVASSGNHDQRTYLAAWGEPYHGLVDEVDYATCDNATLAPLMTGSLLLLHGEADDNVHAEQSVRLCEALLREAKDVTLVLFPGEEHIYRAAAPEAIRRRWDFLVEKLQGLQPPEGFSVDRAAAEARFAT